MRNGCATGSHNSCADCRVGAVLVFVDANPITGNARCDQLEARITLAGKAVMMAAPAIPLT